MYNFTCNNHLRYTIGGRPFGFRENGAEKYEVSLGKIDKDHYRKNNYRSELIRITDMVYKDFGKDIFVDCKYVFDDDIKKLKNLSKYEVIKRLEKYHYLTHKIHKSKKSKVMKIRDKVINLV